MTAYNVFTREYKRRGGAIGTVSKMSEISESWKDLNSAEKIPYETEAFKDKLRYEREKKEYENKFNVELKKKISRTNPSRIQAMRGALKALTKDFMDTLPTITEEEKTRALIHLHVGTKFYLQQRHPYLSIPFPSGKETLNEVRGYMDNWCGNIVMLSGCSANCYIRAACAVTDSLRLLNLDRKERKESNKAIPIVTTPPPTPPVRSYSSYPKPQKIQERQIRQKHRKPQIQEKKRNRNVVGDIIQSIETKRHVNQFRFIDSCKDANSFKNDSFKDDEKDICYDEKDICYDEKDICYDELLQ
jgi:hypothetical protein